MDKKKFMPLTCRACKVRDGNAQHARDVIVESYNSLPGGEVFHLRCRYCGHRWTRDEVSEDAPGLAEAMAAFEKRKTERAKAVVDSDIQYIFDLIMCLPEDKRVQLLLMLSAANSGTTINFAERTIRRGMLSTDDFFVNR